MHDQAATGKLAEDAARDRMKEEREAAQSGEDRSRYVFVFCNSAHPRAFVLGDDMKAERVTFQGQWRLSDFGEPMEAYESNNKAITGGKYGVTRVTREQYTRVLELYGQMPEFRSGLIFAADSLEEGHNRARALSHKRHGLEAAPREVDGGSEAFKKDDGKRK